VNKPSYRYQRTIARSGEVLGVGFLTGDMVRLRFEPAPPDTGVVFVRTDLRPKVVVPARGDQVSASYRRTTLGRAPFQVELVEHVLAALAGLRIDNCRVELNAPEPPGLDGSAQRFVDVLRRSGVVLQPARRPVWTIETSVVVSQQGATLGIHAGGRNELRVSYLLDYGPASPIVRQAHTLVVTPESFCNELAGCRTFILQEEAAELRRQGLGARTTTSDLLVFGPHGVIGNRLRFANEPARHKILDLLGDLSLLGHDLRGHVVAYRSGHSLNVELVRALDQHLLAHNPSQRLAA
jgi:UDP-3-O-acyl N-acetylglucosamine deacetylase